MRKLLAVAASLLALGAWLCLPAGSAGAESADVFDRFEVAAVLDAQGFLTVTETVVLRFGASSGRHGLERVLTTREPDPSNPGKDMLFRVDHVEASSPSGASDRVNLEVLGEGKRSQGLRIRIGDPATTISADTATYRLTYRVLGLVRSPNGDDQLYWDATGSAMPLIRQAQVSVTVPGGAQRVFCSVAAPGSQGSCAKAERDSDNVARFAAADVPVGQVLTVGVAVKPGLVEQNTPILEDDAEKAVNDQLEVAGALGFGSFALSLPAAVVAALLGRRRLRRDTADYRYAGLPPGLIPTPDQMADEVLTRRPPEIPVSFSPPPVALAEAGFLMDGRLDVRDTTATLVGLAVAGAVRLDPGATKQVEFVDAGAHLDRPSRVLLTALFPDKAARKRGAVSVDLPGSLNRGHIDLTDEVRRAAVNGGWYARTPQTAEPMLGIEMAIKAVGAIAVVVVLAAISLVFLGTVGVALVLIAAGALPLVAAILITKAVVARKSASGQRSGIGTALTDQVVGFRTYLASAEAEQLQFEEGEDIFSAYLPWAIVFDLTERWKQVCQRLIDLGRLPAQAPLWYAGTDWTMDGFFNELNDFGSQMNTATGPAVSSSSTSSYSSSDSGFGSSGSAFDGGGFSGGGGGGGGGGSW